MSEKYPLSALQQSYILGKLGYSDDYTGCHTYTEFEFGKELNLNIEKVNQIWNQLLINHPVLRLALDENGRQYIKECEEYKFTKSLDLKSTRERLANKIYSLDEYPLYTITYTELSDSTIFHFSIDSLIVDAYSAKTLFDEMYSAYHGGKITSENQSYFEWYSSWKERSNKQQEKYWANKLSHLDLSNNPLQFKNPSNDNTRYRKSFEFDGNSTKQLIQYCNDKGMLLTALITYAFARVMLNRLKVDRLNIVNTLANRNPVLGKSVNCIGPLTNTEIIEVTSELSIDKISDDLYRDLENSEIELSEKIQNYNGNVYLPFVITVNTDSKSNLDKYKVFEVSQTPNVELENIISVIDGKLIWELNYSRRFFSHEETDDLLSDLKTQMYNFLRSKNIDKEKKNDKEITLSELQQGYVLDNIKYGQVNFVLRKFTTTMDSISELNGVIRTLVDTYPFLSYEIEQFSYIKETENSIYHQLRSLDDIIHIMDLNRRPLEIGYCTTSGGLELVFVFSMIYLNSSSIIYLIEQVEKMLNGEIDLIRKDLKFPISYQEKKFDKNYWKQKFSNIDSVPTTSWTKLEDSFEVLKRRCFTFGMWSSVEAECVQRGLDASDFFLSALICALKENGIRPQFYPVVVSKNPNIFYEDFIDDSTLYWIDSSPDIEVVQQGKKIFMDRKNDLINYSSDLLTWLHKEGILPRSQVVITDCRSTITKYKEEFGYSKSSGISLDIVLNKNEYGLQIELNYLESVYDETTLDHIVDNLRDSLIQLLKNEGENMKEIGVSDRNYTVEQMRSYLKFGKKLSKETFKKIVYDFNDTVSEVSYKELIYDGFDQNVIKTPDKIAVITDSMEVTYKELSDLVDRFAYNLSIKLPSISQGDVIAVALDRSVEMVAVLLAILKLRCSYLPLSTTDGYRRIEEILNDAKPIAVITDGGLDSKVNHSCIINLESLNNEIEKETDLSMIGHPEDLAYIIFTSGSTGKPKGVQINHESVVNLFLWMEDELRLKDFGKVLAVNPLNFDLSVFDIFGTLHLGGTIRLLSTEDRLNIFKIIEIIQTEQISLWNSAPAYLKMVTDEMMLSDKIYNSLKHILLSGDWIPTEMISTVKTLFPNSNFIALGGATEATVWSNFFNAKDYMEGMSTVPYGKPIWNSKYYILNSDLTPCEIDEVGDLYISGICLSPGYLNDPDKNKASFLDNPYESNLLYQKLYKTGDLAKYLPDGTIIFCGRKDNQVEINGYRVELGEIDSCFKELGLKDVITLFSDKELIVYTTSQLSDSEKQHFREKSRENLASYMVPNRIISIPEFPITINGKVDRKKLEKMKEAKDIHKESAEKSSSSLMLKQLLFNICSEIVDRNITEAEYELNLGDLGFSSLQFALLSSKLNQRLNQKVNPALFYKYDSIKKIVSFLEEEKNTQNNKDVISGGENSRKSDSLFKFNNDDIAIIGLSARMPEAVDEIEFFNNLIDGKDTTREIPDNRWNWKEFYGDEGTGNSKTKVNKAHFMKEIDSFDRQMFKLSPHEARMMDPRQRILLEETGNLLQKSGYDFDELRGQNIGVFIGATGDEYYNLLINQKKEISPYSMIGTSKTILANRISYFFDWHGPSEVIDTACSSSLVALHNAILSLQNRDCSKALVAGINVILDPLPHIGLAETGMLSPDGRCKTLDSAADGYGRGEGVGLILLETVGEANKNSDNILCTVKTSAVNHGGKANSLTSPNISAQSDLLERCYQSPTVDLKQLKYIELHGTGTALGDPIEIEALNEALGSKVQVSQVGLGAVKTNIGHLEAAAGISGVIKCVMAYRFGLFPANLGPNKLNPNIDLDGTPFYPVNENQMLPKGETILMGISSFGFGGTNAHVVLGGIVNE